MDKKELKRVLEYAMWASKEHYEDYVFDSHHDGVPDYVDEPDHIHVVILRLLDELNKETTA